jgi:hypothetical protein
MVFFTLSVSFSPISSTAAPAQVTCMTTSGHCRPRCLPLRQSRRPAWQAAGFSPPSTSPSTTTSSPSSSSLPRLLHLLRQPHTALAPLPLRRSATRQLSRGLLYCSPDTNTRSIMVPALARPVLATPVRVFVPDASPGLENPDRRLVFIDFVFAYIVLAKRIMPSSPTCT